MNFERLSENRYRIPREGAMRVEAVFYASESILSDLAAEDYASLKQLENVATLPGIVGPALAMPDVHWGYGFPIGGVAAFEAGGEGVVSPGGVGFDINCGVRLLVSDLEREDLVPRARELADALFAAVPSGVGRGRRDLGLGRRELSAILHEGPRALVDRGYTDPADLENVESRGMLPGADPEAVSERAYKRGASQLGTLGSGNHFLEVQYVDEVYDREAAPAFGLQEGRVTVLIHSGSRGLG
ncbi:MAG: RtcB family protein, partial [Rubrobacteraceae bacterium]|nr:RtcB family protein [Rubrobacteraceae bacterium]